MCVRDPEAALVWCERLMGRAADDSRLPDMAQ
jgi:hypothetical protein